MRKLISIVLALGMTICVITPAFGAALTESDADLELSADVKVYSNATLADNFADDGVLVVLSNKASLQFQDYKSSDFSEIGCLAVTDYSSASGKNTGPSRYFVQSNYNCICTRVTICGHS